MSDTQTSTKVLDRLAKLLALANDHGATEAEAQLAMEMAQRIMAEHNLTTAEVEARGGQGESRDDIHLEGKAMYDYQQQLMSVLGTVNFSLVLIRRKLTGKRDMPTGYRIIGRKSNVAAVVNMFEYLNETINRLIRDKYPSRETLSRHAMSWKFGVSQRLQERLTERHEKMLEEQARTARERQATQQHPSAATSNAVVVVMTDFAQDEKDFNTDLRQGLKPGTTKAQRLEYEANAAAREARWAEGQRARDEAEQARLAGMTDKQRAKLEEKAEREWQRWQEQAQRKRDRFWQNKDTSAYFAGRKAGENISLDQQVENKPMKGIK